MKNLKNHRPVCALNKLLLLILLVLVAGIFPSTAAESVSVQKRQASWLGTLIGATTSGGVDQIFDDEILKAVQASLGGKYQNLEIVVMACHSGGFVDPLITTNLGTNNWSIAASAAVTNEEAFTSANFDNAVTNAAGKATPGFKAPTKSGAVLYFYGWGPQWLRQLGIVNTTTAVGLAQYAQSNQTEPFNPLQFAFGGTGDRAKIHDEMKTNRMIFWQSGLDVVPGGRKNTLFTYTTYRAFLAAGYDTKSIDLAFENFIDTDITGGFGNPVIPNRDATKAALFQQITDLGTAFSPAANPPTSKGLIWIRAHGNTESRVAQLENGAIDGLANQGSVYNSTKNSLTLTLTPDMVQTFFLGNGTNDQSLDAIGQPTFLLSTAAESSDLGPVGVSINGVFIGSIQMQATSQGADYVLALSHSALNALFLSNSLASNNYQVSIVFSFTSGSFRVATSWDFDLGNRTHWGIGLTGPALATINNVAPLFITPSGTNVILTWGTSATDLTLQSTTNLVAPNSWNPVSPAPVVIDGLNTVTNPISPNQMFYRLGP